MNRMWFALNSFRQKLLEVISCRDSALKDCESLASLFYEAEREAEPHMVEAFECDRSGCLVTAPNSEVENAQRNAAAREITCDSISLSSGLRSIRDRASASLRDPELKAKAAAREIMKE